MKISGVAVVSGSNAPLYISTFGIEEEEGLRLQALFHSSLDVVDERVGLGCRQAPTAPIDAFLGLLFLSEGHRIYGLVSNTKTKFLVSTQGGDERGEDVRMVLANVHAAYSDAVCNPFYELDAPLSSHKFASAVQKVVANPVQPPPPLAAA